MAQMNCHYGLALQLHIGAISGSMISDVLEIVDVRFVGRRDVGVLVVFAE